MKCFGSLKDFYFWFCCLLLFVGQNLLPTLCNRSVTGQREPEKSAGLIIIVVDFSE